MDIAISGTRKRGRPSNGAVSIHLRIEPELLSIIDAKRGDRSRPDEIRRLIQVGHEAEG